MLVSVEVEVFEGVADYSARFAISSESLNRRINQFWLSSYEHAHRIAVSRHVALSAARNASNSPVTA